MAVSKRVRFEVLRRDNHQCRYCGAAAPDAPLTIDHVVPVALGGSDDPSNLVTACKDCNSGKTSTAPDSRIVEEVSADALRWADALKQAAAERESKYAGKRARVHEFRELWEAWTVGGRTVDLPGDYGVSVHQLLAAGLTVVDFEELIEVAMTASQVRGAAAKWKYFCGCCWTRARQANDRAAEIVGLDDEEPEEDRNSEAYVMNQRASVEMQWQKHYGVDLAWCLCSYVSGRHQYCGSPACMREVVTLAHGVLMGPEYVFRIVSAPVSEVEESEEGEEVSE
ncbi:HNH endonuclease [Micromonospora sp. NPDC048169]|uniref:HNH endonuclease n=1 Tax=Micromonospora sp. NPDC048169 TaxID=3154711 RepID=UPI0033FA2D70